MDRVLTVSELSVIEQDIASKGVKLSSPVVQEGRVVSVRFEK